MKQALIKMSQHPQVKAACLSVVAELSAHGLTGLREQLIDTLARPIAYHWYELEKKAKQQEKEQ